MTPSTASLDPRTITAIRTHLYNYLATQPLDSDVFKLAQTCFEIQDKVPSEGPGSALQIKLDSLTKEADRNSSAFYALGEWSRDEDFAPLFEELNIEHGNTEALISSLTKHAEQLKETGEKKKRFTLRQGDESGDAYAEPGWYLDLLAPGIKSDDVEDDVSFGKRLWYIVSNLTHCLLSETDDLR